MNKHIITLFELFYNKLYKESYKIDLTLNNQQKMLDNFVKRLNKKAPSAGINFLSSYFAFGMAYYYSKKLKRKISFGWLTGKKLLDRYFEREDGTDYYTSEFLRENNINLDEVKSSLVESIVATCLRINPEEEVAKGRVADTEARLYSCLVDTTLFNHRSPVCLICHQKGVCKYLLKKSNLSLYKKRGYE